MGLEDVDLLHEWQDLLRNLERFSDIADELGLELSPYQKGIVRGHIRRLQLEIKTHSEDMNDPGRT